MSASWLPAGQFDFYQRHRDQTFHQIWWKNAMPRYSQGPMQRFSVIPVPTRYRGSTHVWSRIQYRLGCFQGPVSDSVPFRLVSESRIQSQIRLRFFLSPGFSPGFDRPGQDPAFGTELHRGHPERRSEVRREGVSQIRTNSDRGRGR